MHGDDIKKTMFSNALKSFSSSIGSNYTLEPKPSSSSGPWNIFDAKHKKSGKSFSVFVFDKKSLEPAGGGLRGSSSTSAIKRVHEQIFERLRKEASSLARLRHPSVLELAEPVEETRSGGLMFATEPVTASLAGLLQEKDEQERSGGVGGRGSRYVVEESDGTRKRRELEIDELEIQKGLLQLGKGLEFLHESAGLVHANLTPEAVLINAKGDWKISGLAFCGPHESSNTPSSITPISLSEVLNHDPRLPRSVQLNLDYTSPDFVLDNNLNPSSDLFSLGLLVIALYNSPHHSPLQSAGSLSTYKRTFSSNSSVPSQSNNFLVPRTNPLPPKLASDLLPRLITRRPAQRLSAREFQEASYFDNILVSTIRFLDALPAKTPNEKAQFMRGLPKIMPQFPKSVLEKKVLPALLEEMKDRDLLAPILSNIFAMVQAMPTGKRAFTEKVVPRLREIFLTKANVADKDPSKEAGLMILLEQMPTVAENCQGKAFHDDILPIILLALDSPTHGLVDAALSTLPSVLPMLDFSTIKNELFPAIAAVFAKTSSLTIKVRGLEAFYTLCGGSSAETSEEDDLNGIGVPDKKSSNNSSSIILDKFTVQEKVVPLLKGIKTKESGVMVAALKVFKQVGQVADSDYLAMEVLPILWQFSLGPLLNLQQFQAFMTLIKNLGTKIEQEQTRKLRELSSGNSGLGAGAGTARLGRQTAISSTGAMGNGEETDFETLVSGRKIQANGNNDDLMNDWVTPAATNLRNTANQNPTFSWQSATPAAQPSRSMQQQNTNNTLRPQRQHSSINRTVTPDQSLNSFATLTPASQYSQPLQPSRTGSQTTMPMRPSNPPNTNAASSIDWSKAAAANNSPVAAWSSTVRTQQQGASSSDAYGIGNGGRGAGAAGVGGFGLPPPPTSPQAVGQGFQAPPFGGQQRQRQRAGAGGSGNVAGGKSGGGLDRYESLL